MTTLHPRLRHVTVPLEFAVERDGPLCFLMFRDKMIIKSGRLDTRMFDCEPAYNLLPLGLDPFR